MKNSDSNSLILSTVKTALPAFNGGGATYNSIAKMFLSCGWCSLAGNVYQEGVRLSNHLVVKYNIGHGYCHSFLNGINLYAFDGTGLKLIASDNSYYNFWWSDSSVRSETISLLTKTLADQCRIEGCRNVDVNQVHRLATELVDETIKTTEAIGNYALAASGSKALLK